MAHLNMEKVRRMRLLGRWRGGIEERTTGKREGRGRGGRRGQGGEREGGCQALRNINLEDSSDEEMSMN
eukprot:647109-Hanusia_phi.AAC.3